ncbi:Flp pilus assembly protein CpaB [Pectinatus sottacetonis]|uniref:Flp pilus assembly protein CpaB n=1 Tax=Pectinatus sottacetonis TaxID=1002795 RepID=UPI0018C83AB4|nr:Flp pilus assembly protein CpaB [Pectinatus sottacetonis]
MRSFKLMEFLTKKLEKFSSQQLIIMAAVTAVLFSVILGIYLSSLQKAAEKVKTGNMTTVIMANQDIPINTTLKENMLKTVMLPADSLPATPVSNMADAVGKIAKIPIMAGDIVTIPKLFINSELAGFVGTIPDNCRAISVKISDVTGVAGFARPGDHVDVAFVANGRNGRSGKIILQNILLLGINSTAIDKEKTKKKDDNHTEPKLATATLAVPPEDALKLAVAQSEGTVFLVLRPFKPDEGFIADTDYFIPRDGQINDKQNTDNNPREHYPITPGQAPALAQAHYEAAQPVMPVDNGHSITIIRGTAKSKVEVR